MYSNINLYLRPLLVAAVNTRMNRFFGWAGIFWLTAIWLDLSILFDRAANDMRYCPSPFDFSPAPHGWYNYPGSNGKIKKLSSSSRDAINPNPMDQYDALNATHFTCNISQTMMEKIQKKIDGQVQHVPGDGRPIYGLSSSQTKNGWGYGVAPNLRSNIIISTNHQELSNRLGTLACSPMDEPKKHAGVIGNVFKSAFGTKKNFVAWDQVPCSSNWDKAPCLSSFKPRISKVGLETSLKRLKFEEIVNSDISDSLNFIYDPSVITACLENSKCTVLNNTVVRNFSLLWTILFLLLTDL